MTFDPAKSVYTPPDSVIVAKQQIDRIKKESFRRVDFPVEGIDQYCAPMLPGEMCMVIGQTSNGKSQFGHFWARKLAKQLDSDGRDEMIVHVSVEEAIETMTFYSLAAETEERAGDLARGIVQDWDRLNEAIVRVGTIPIYRIGSSLARSEDYPNLTISNMIRAIDYIQDTWPGVRIAAMFFDYLQAFAIDHENRGLNDRFNQRRHQITDDVNRLRQVSAKYGCPVIVMVQAKQILNLQRPSCVPGIYDGQESSSIAQRADRIIQLAMPKMHYALGQMINISDSVSYVVRENSIFIEVGKQRGGMPSGAMFPCLIDFRTQEITLQDRSTYQQSGLPDNFRKGR
jgi:replicative DNA helicase